MYFYDERVRTYGSSRQVDFFADEASDINNLPTTSTDGVKQGENDVSNKIVAPGSSCFVIATGDKYILNSNDEWIKI